ncbi:MAG: adenylate/guanylate cyclase domain-containing protein [Thermoanaerobaculales bacterium]|jgi:adenylate cyclase|nr:adenylate/guanylate cyclase domain-containing protein [Thermoanaerobaculales bacterium]
MLELIYDDAEGAHRVPIRESLTFGRSNDNDVVLRDFSVSRYHARIDVEDGVPRMTDLGSTNGVRINEAAVASGPLAAGDRVTIGSFTLLVEDADELEPGLSSATYLRPLSEFNEDYGLEGRPAPVSASEEIGGRQRVFEVLAQVGKTLIEVGELEPVLEQVMDVVFDELLVDRGFIVLLDGEGDPQLESFRTRESAGEEPEVPISRTILDMVTQRKVAILTHDAQADQRFESGQSVRIHQIRSAMCAPLWLRERVIGVIYVDSPLHVGSFSTADLDLLTALANYAAVGIERARLNERIRSERAARDRLERYHSPAVIEAVLGGVDHEEPSVTLRETSIMFADIVGFTARCESLPPEEVAAFLNQFFSLAADAIFEFGGTLDKFIGDAVMAFFGAPLPQDDHAERAVRAALALTASLEAWNRDRLADGIDPIKIRVAVHSGPVVVGDIGSASRVDYTVLGNTVNIAARLEEFVASPGSIVVGESTHAAVKDLFATESLGEVPLKGLSKKIGAFRIVDGEPASGREQLP